MYSHIPSRTQELPLAAWIAIAALVGLAAPIVIDWALQGSLTLSPSEPLGDVP